jgi:beta-N-acetylhexosaminidase
MKQIFSSVTKFFVLVLIPNFVLAQSPATSSTKGSVEAKAGQSTQLEAMTLEQKVGQLFIIGFPQQRVDSQLESFIKKYNISSFILFKRNIVNLAQVAQMNSRLQTVAMGTNSINPIIAVDQEGGQVARVPTRPPIPNAMSVGQTEDPELAHSLGQETAKIIRTLGFNMNLAPVLDVASPESESFIGQRSFGSDATRVGVIGAALSQGHLDEAVIPTAKHFPGVGSMNEDPHKKKIEYNVSAKELFEKDLKPFEEFAKLGPNTAIMMSHFSYPTLDASKTPATLSPTLIKKILRGQLGYQGLIVTDDIQMKGLTEVSSTNDAALRALKAGADLIMMTWSFKEQAKAIERVQKAVASGELSKEELDEKVGRILAIKEHLRLITPKLTGIANPKVMALSTKKLREIENRILDFNIRVALRKTGSSARGLTAVTPNQNSTTGLSENESADPASEINGSATAANNTNATDADRTCVYSPTRDFIGSFKKTGSNFSGFEITLKTKSAMIVQHMKAKACKYGVFVVHGPKTATLLETIPLEFAKRLLVVNLNTPSLVPDVEKYLNVVNLYFPHPEAGKKISENLRALARRVSLKDSFAHYNE